MENYKDTIEFYFDSKETKMHMPKIIFGIDYVFFLSSSSSYRYVTLSYFDKRRKRISTNKYETSRDVSATIDGAVYFKERYCYFYDIAKHEIHYMPFNANINSVEEISLFNENSVLIANKNKVIKKCEKQDFSKKGRLLTGLYLK